MIFEVVVRISLVKILIESFQHACMKRKCFPVLCMFKGFDFLKYINRNNCTSIRIFPDILTSIMMEKESKK